MPNYSTLSDSRLYTCHQDIITIMKTVILYFDNTIVCGNRGKQAQDQAFAQGFSTVEYPNSKHNCLPSMAVDSIPYPVNWKDVNRMRYYAGFVVAISWMLYDQGKTSHVMTSGLDWDNDTELSDTRFRDAPHFQIYKP